MKKFLLMLLFSSAVAQDLSEIDPPKKPITIGSVKEIAKKTRQKEHDKDLESCVKKGTDHILLQAYVAAHTGKSFIFKDLSDTEYDWGYCPKKIEFKLESMGFKTNLHIIQLKGYGTLTVLGIGW